MLFADKLGYVEPRGLDVEHVKERRGTVYRTRQDVYVLHDVRSQDKFLNPVPMFVYNAKEENMRV